MTKDFIGPKLSDKLIEDRQGAAKRLLSPLLEGKPVWLNVEDKRLPKKTRGYKTVLVIAPISALGVDGGQLLVAMPPYGAEFVDVTAPIKAISFARLGLSFTLAKALAEALGVLYGGSHGA